MGVVIGLLLFSLAAASLALQRVYQHVPIKELRRRARAGEDVAGLLYQVAAYGASLKVTLGVVAVLANAGLFFFIANNSAPWVAIGLIMLLLWLFYIWLPMQSVQRWTVKVAAWISPPLARVLHYLHPLVDRVHAFIRRHRPLHVHSGMYEVDDLLELLRAQAQQVDNRISPAALHVAQAALTFADKQIRSIYTPRRVVKSVAADDAIGPVLLSELHESGFSRFPVYEADQPDNIVGILLLRDLVDARKGGKVRTYMHKKVCYIHEEQTLEHGLDAIIKTHQQLFVVVNSFEEYIGVVSIEDILEEVIGRSIMDEFDAYEDMRAVAASQAKDDQDARHHPAPLQNTDDELVE